MYCFGLLTIVKRNLQVVAVFMKKRIACELQPHLIMIDSLRPLDVKRWLCDLISVAGAQQLSTTADHNRCTESQ